MSKVARKINFCTIFDSSPEGITSVGCIGAYKLVNPNDDISVAILAKDGKVDLKDPELSSWPFKSLEKEINNPCDFKYHTIGMVPLAQMSVVPSEGVRSFIFPAIHTSFPLDVRKAVGNTVKGFLGSFSSYSTNVLSQNFPKTNIRKIPLAMSLKGESCQIINQEDPVEFWSKQLGYSFPKNIQIVGSIGPFQERKGHNRLVDAVTKIGTKRPILLITSWFNPMINTGFPHYKMHSSNYEPIYNKSNIYLYKKKDSYICFLPRVGIRSRLHELYSKIHVYCAPSLAESFNLSLFEIMSIGTLSCATFNTGHLDYVNKQNCIEIESDNSLTSANDGIYYRGESSWHEVSPTSIVKSLDTCINLSTDQKIAYINTAISELPKKFNWENTGSILTQSLWK